MRLANPLQGTDSTSLFSRGNTLPIVALPFAMAHWALQSSDANSWFFQPHDERLQGIRCTHQLSPWLDDYGYATFLPFNGEPSPEAGERASSYRAAELEIAPHAAGAAANALSLQAGTGADRTVRRDALHVRGVRTGGSVHRSARQGCRGHCNLDAARELVAGLTRANHGGVPAGFAGYYVVQCDAEITGFDVKEVKGRRDRRAAFHAQAGKPVTLRVGTSFISYDQAARNLKNEVGDKPFDQVRSEAAAAWETALGRVRIEGATETQRKVFYSCLYRTLLFPRMWHEHDEDGKVVHFSALQRQGRAGRDVRRPRILGRLSRVVSDDGAALSRAAERDSSGVGECVQRGRMVSAVSVSRISQLHDGQPD